MSEPDLIVERQIAASLATVFSFFADPQRWLRWQGIEATIEPRPGGRFRMNVRGDGFAAGRFTEVVPGRRIVFTWGWEHYATRLAVAAAGGTPAPTPPWCPDAGYALRSAGSSSRSRRWARNRAA